jgi:hypothetical protein
MQIVRAPLPMARLDAWITTERLSTYAAVLAACLWGLLLTSLSTPGLLDRSGLLKGADFLQFYVSGSLLAESKPELLYDAAANRAQAERLVPESAGLTYLPIYGPQVALLFRPFAAVPYGLALLLWSLTSALLYGACCALVWRTCSHLGEHPELSHRPWLPALLAIAYPPLFRLIGYGQTSALALACVCAAWLAFRSGRYTLAGFAIGGLFYKPQLGVAAAFVFLLAGERRVVQGALASVAVQLGLAWAVCGGGALVDYGRTVAQLPDLAPVLGFKLHQMHSWRAFFALLLPEALVPLAWAVAAGATLVLALRAWRSEATLELRFASLLVATALANPHQYIYDLVILAPAWMLLADWLAGHRRHPAAPALRILLAASFVLPVLGPLAKLTHLQLSVPVLAALGWKLYGTVRYEAGATRRARSRSCRSVPAQRRKNPAAQAPTTAAKKIE